MKARTKVKEENTHITSQRAAKLLRMTPRNVRILCSQGRIKGATKFGRDWAIPNPPKLLLESDTD